MSERQLEFVLTQNELRKNIAQFSNTIQNALKGKQKTLQIKLQHPAGTIEHPVFNKEITLTLFPDDRKGKEPEDLPDLVDVFETTLPWTGIVTLNTMSRQYRNKYKAAVVIKVTLELNNKLFKLFDENVATRIELPEDRPKPMVYIRKPVVSVVHEPAVMIRHMSEMSNSEASAHCTPDGNLDTAMVEYLDYFGYRHSGKVSNYLHQFTCESSTLTVYEYGVILDF